MTTALLLLGLLVQPTSTSTTPHPTRSAAGCTHADDSTVFVLVPVMVQPQPTTRGLGAVLADLDKKAPPPRPRPRPARKTTAKANGRRRLGRARYFVTQE